MGEILLAERRGAVQRMTLNRPERRNALSTDLLRTLHDNLAATAADPEIAVLVLAGAGSVFSAGHDLAEMARLDSAGHEVLFDLCRQVMECIQELPQPVIAQVHGVATAAGCQMVAACDLAVAADTASFAVPGVKIGLFCSTPAVPLVRAIGRKRALQMLLTGQPISAATAMEWGLVNQVVPAMELDRAVDDLAQAICQASTATVAAGKRCFYEQVELDDASAYRVAGQAMVDGLGHPDATEGIRAFLAKEKPRWRGRKEA